MATDQNTPADGDEQVVPPENAAPGAWTPGVPLAPPLPGTPAAPPQSTTPPPPYGGAAQPTPAPPSAGTPQPPMPPYAGAPYAGAPYAGAPYAGAQQPPAPMPPWGAASQQPAPVPPYAAAASSPPPPYAPSSNGGYPGAPVPPARSGSRPWLIVLGVAGGVGILVVIAIVVVSVLLARATPDPIAAPSFAPLPTASSAPSDEEPSAAPSDGDDGPVDTGASADIGAALESKIAEYKKLRDSGALWERIPDTEFNRTAVTAFLFFLSDMKAATIWGVDDATATEYEERMAMLEQKLLDQKPLGDNIKITFEGGKVFQYNGETGEGGYTQE